MKEVGKKKEHKKVDILDIINGLLLGALIAMVLFVPFLHSYPADTRQVSYTTDTTQDASLELGDSKVTQEGKDGEVLITNKLTYSLFGYLFRRDFIIGKEVSEETTEEPINEVVANGTKKYQYMWCSNGSYVSYTNAQFEDPNTGFTHLSQDYCAKDGDGKMTQLADSAPVAHSSSGSPNSSNSITSNTLGPLVQLSGPDLSKLQYQPVPYNPPALTYSTPAPPRSITVTPVRPTPSPCTYSYVCQ